MLDDEIGAPRKDLVQFVESPRNKVGFGVIVAGKWMRPFDNPVDPIVDMLKEVGTTARFESLE